jgi:hypothetical protein
MKLTIIIELAATAANKAAKEKKGKEENIIMISSFSCFENNFLPPAARGVLFEKTTPLDPLQKLLFILISIRAKGAAFMRNCYSGYSS